MHRAVGLAQRPRFLASLVSHCGCVLPMEKQWSLVLGARGCLADDAEQAGTVAGQRSQAQFWLGRWGPGHIDIIGNLASCVQIVGAPHADAVDEFIETYART